MRRSEPQAPHFSFFSVALTVFFLLGLGLLILIHGGSAFSPGPVSAIHQNNQEYGGFSSHADFEEQCFYCHQPLKISQDQLCLNCHTNIQEKIDLREGIHGQFENNFSCADCHAEHRGRAYDSVQAALTIFNHAWVNFRIDGAHLLVECAQCHLAERYDQANPACVSCHHEPDQHSGLFGDDCQTCHTTSAWLPATYPAGQHFDHERTRFSLVLHQVDQHAQPMRCVACHTNDVENLDTRQCQQCHQQIAPAFMEAHLTFYGEKCLDCHDGLDRMHNFDHQVVFPLEGRHASLACESCHIARNFTNLDPACATCHQEPEIHRGQFGLQCNYCHTADAWQPALLHEHTFPLDHGGRGESTCQTCHSENYGQYTCYSCHEHQPAQIIKEHQEAGIGAGRLADCAACHLNGEIEPDEE